MKWWQKVCNRPGGNGNEKYAGVFKSKNQSEPLLKYIYCQMKKIAVTSHTILLGVLSMASIKYI